MTSQSLTPLALARPAPPGRTALRSVVAAALQLASHALARLAARVGTGPTKPPALSATHLEFHADAGAPEGALYADGVLVAVLPGVTRL